MASGSDQGNLLISCDNRSKYRPEGTLVGDFRYENRRFKQSRE